MFNGIRNFITDTIELDNESYNKCLGQNKCNDCPRYLDDCDGNEDMIEE